MSSSVVAQYGRLPMAFEPALPAQGAKFLAHGDGYTIFLNPNKTTFALRGQHANSVLNMKFDGAAVSALAPDDELPGKSNYFLGNKPENWRTSVPNYRKVTQRGVYKGVDVVYYGTQRELEYDLVVSPGANPSVVRFSFDGSKNLRTDSRGELLVGLSDGVVRLHKPVAYQEVDGQHRMVAASYVLEAKNSVSFKLGPYDATKTLVIDPVLAYSTYLGGSNIDGANAIAVASDNTAFVAGGTFSSDFPVVHALQPNAGGPNDFPQDAFVSKISADGSTLLYSTYLGGELQDVANGIAVDSFGEAYVIGTTISPNFPVTTLAFNTLCGGDGQCGATWNPDHAMVTNGFVTKLNVEGSGLIYSTFIGYYENVRGNAIAVDSNQIAYITGQVGPNITPTVPITPPQVPPPPFPITATAFQPAFGGGTTDVFLIKLSATGTTGLYSSYLGGSNEDIGYGIAADNSGFAYLTGLTYSTDLPLVAALQTTSGGNGDALIAKVNTNGSGAGSLVFSTYLGGNGLDQGNGIAIDSVSGSGNIYIAGTSNSATLGVTPNGAQLTNNGQGDAFVLKLTNAGSLTYFTFLGGSLADAGLGIAVDSTGNAYVTGSTVSTDFPIAGTVFQKAFAGGNSDAFVTKLDPTGKTLIYSSYLGGTNTDVGYGIGLDSAGSAYVAGQTCSQDFPVANALQAGSHGNCDAFISKVSTLGGIAINPAGLVFPAQSVGVTSPQQSVTISNTNDTASVSISSIVITGDFAQTNNCPPVLAAGANCTVNVTFDPTAPGIRKGTITVSDNAPGSPQIINLSGSTSTLTLSASTLSFGTQTVGLASTAQTVRVTNTGTTPITVSSIAASGDFAETNNCGSSLPAGTNCTISITYTPSSAGQSLGAVTISDDAPGSPQSILLTGTGVGQQVDFTMAATPPSATLPAGSSTVLAVTITPVGGFSQPINLGCTGLPAGANCLFSADPAAPTGPTVVEVLVTTAARTTLPPVAGPDHPSTPTNLNRIFLAGLALVLLSLWAARLRRRPAIAAFGMAAALMLVSAGCGGGQAGVPAGTPAGSYQVAVVGTSGSLKHSATITLQVQ